MSLFTDLYDAHLTIGGHAITWREILGNGFGLASAIGGMRRKVWAWPVGIVGNVLLFTVFFFTATSNDHPNPLLGQAGRQVFFIVVSVYGWWRWQKNKASGVDAPAVRPRWATGRERAAYLAVWGAAVGVCYVAFTQITAGFPAEWWFYLADAWIFVGSMLATYAMARGWNEFWLAWIAVDLVGVPLGFATGYVPTAVMYTFYGMFVIYGFFQWVKVTRAEAAKSAEEVEQPAPVA